MATHGGSGRGLGLLHHFAIIGRLGGPIDVRTYPYAVVIPRRVGVSSLGSASTGSCPARFRTGSTGFARPPSTGSRPYESSRSSRPRLRRTGAGHARAEDPRTRRSTVDGPHRARAEEPEPAELSRSAHRPARRTRLRRGTHRWRSDERPTGRPHVERFTGRSVALPGRSHPATARCRRTDAETRKTLTPPNTEYRTPARASEQGDHRGRLRQSRAERKPSRGEREQGDRRRRSLGGRIRPARRRPARRRSETADGDRRGSTGAGHAVLAGSRESEQSLRRPRPGGDGRSEPAALDLGGPRRDDLGHPRRRHLGRTRLRRRGRRGHPRARAWSSRCPTHPGAAPR